MCVSDRGVGNVTDVKQREYDKACSRLPLSVTAAVYTHSNAMHSNAIHTVVMLYPTGSQ